jgi:hypothetical protein
MAHDEDVEIKSSNPGSEAPYEQKLDPHAKPPEALKTFYKRYQKLKSKDIEYDADLIDFEQPEQCSGLRLVHEVNYRIARATGTGELEKHDDGNLVSEFLNESSRLVKVYEHDDVPGKALLTSFSYFDAYTCAHRTTDHPKPPPTIVAKVLTRQADPPRHFKPNPPK